MKRILMAMAIVLISGFGGVFSNKAHAIEACTYYSAQLMATVREVTQDADGACRLHLTWEKRWMYNPQYVCPLDIDEVSSFGIRTLECNVGAGDELSGVVMRTRDAAPTEITIH